MRPHQLSPLTRCRRQTTAAEFNKNRLWELDLGGQNINRPEKPSGWWKKSPLNSHRLLQTQNVSSVANFTLILRSLVIPSGRVSPSDTADCAAQRQADFVFISTASPLFIFFCFWDNTLLWSCWFTLRWYVGVSWSWCCFPRELKKKRFKGKMEKKKIEKQSWLEKLWKYLLPMAAISAKIML